MKKIMLLSIFFSLGLILNAQQVIYNFNDGSWGDVITDRLESGSYPSFDINNVKLTNAYLYQKDGKGTMRIVLDKRSTNSNIEFPKFETPKKEVVIDASVGTDGKTLVLEQKIGNKWLPVGDPVTLTKQKASYSFSLSETAIQIRILNPTTSALYVYKVVIK